MIVLLPHEHVHNEGKGISEKFDTDIQDFSLDTKMNLVKNLNFPSPCQGLDIQLDGEA